MVMLGESIPEIIANKPLRINDWRSSYQFMEFNLFLRLHTKMCDTVYNELSVELRQAIYHSLKEQYLLSEDL